MTTAALVLLFSTVADPSRAARLHAASCAMVNTGKRGGKVRLIVDEPPGYLQEVVDDLNEREFPVKKCKCCK